MFIYASAMVHQGIMTHYTPLAQRPEYIRGGTRTEHGRLFPALAEKAYWFL